MTDIYHVLLRSTIEKLNCEYGMFLKHIIFKRIDY